MSETESFTPYMERLKQIIEKNISPENLIGAAYRPEAGDVSVDNELAVAVFYLDDISSGEKLEDIVPYLIIKSSEKYYKLLVKEARSETYVEPKTIGGIQSRRVMPDSLVHALDLEVENIFLTPLSKISEKVAVSLKYRYKDMLLQS